MSTALKYQVTAAIRACEEKKAEAISILRMDKNSGVFTDYFVICSGGNPRQVQAIADEVKDRLQIAGLDPTHTEGYQQAEWVLLDYVDFVVHIFSEKARRFYDLERLWKSAERLTPAQVLAPEKKPAARIRQAKPATRRKTSRRSILAAGKNGKRAPRKAKTRARKKR
ncbi:MAG TPA: ribosome silencing factor [Terriglobales bacterium]|nr:ribosome silencing factor [Terriglobales bacterium]